MDEIALSAKAQFQYNKELGQARRGWNRGVQEVQEVVREVVREEVCEEVQGGLESEGDDGVSMVHVIDQQLDEVRRKMDRMDVMVWAVVQKEIRRGSQQTLERFVEGLGDEEPEDLKSFEGIDNWYVLGVDSRGRLESNVRSWVGEVNG